MEPEIIDWDNLHSEFVEDDTYEHLNAPQWVDLSAPDEQPVDADAWFCNRNCMHPKTAEDYTKSTRNSKVKFLRSVSITEMLSFRDRARRSVKLSKEENPYTDSLKTELESIPAENFSEDGENNNPNLPSLSQDHNALPKKGSSKSNMRRKKRQLDGFEGNSSKGLKSTFSARNLQAGKEILNQITEFCSELRRFAKKGSKSKREPTETVSVGGVGEGEMKKTEREKERMPLLEVKEKVVEG